MKRFLAVAAAASVLAGGLRRRRRRRWQATANPRAAVGALTWGKMRPKSDLQQGRGGMRHAVRCRSNYGRPPPGRLSRIAVSRIKHTSSGLQVPRVVIPDQPRAARVAAAWT